jgi:hypothetical protein
MTTSNQEWLIRMHLEQRAMLPIEHEDYLPISPDRLLDIAKEMALFDAWDVELDTDQADYEAYFKEVYGGTTKRELER